MVEFVAADGSVLALDRRTGRVARLPPTDARDATHAQRVVVRRAHRPPPAAPRGRGPVLAGGAAVLVLAVAVGAYAQNLAPAGGDGDPRAAGLAAAAAWADSLSAHRTPRLPRPGATEDLLVLMDRPGLAWVPRARRDAAATALRAAQQALEPRIAALGGTVTARWRVTVAGLAVTVPSGRADALATVEGVRAVVPVTYLAPAAQATGPAGPVASDTVTTLPRGRPAHIALIDTAIDPDAPQLGGGMGPTFPVIGGADLVDGDGDPTAGPDAPLWEAHGTQMAGLVLRHPALGGLLPQQVPRLLAYRVVAAEEVDGRSLPLARTDRVVSAIERAMDPDGDGDPQDGAQVVLLGVAGGFAGAGEDPVALATQGATLAGAVVVAPAGNDGPTFARLGSLGQPASATRVLTVGGLSSAGAPRQATLALRLGPAGAELRNLPLLGPDPPPTPGRLVVLPGTDGPGPGVDPAEYAGVDVRGAIVVVSRGDGLLQDKAATAAAAGAVAVLVWDRTGIGVFPSGASGGGPVIPLLGAGQAQGDALVRLLSRSPDLRATIETQAQPPAPATVASFSSTGPTADGRVKPDLVAPAVEVPTAWPPSAGGGARSASMTGTSAAAAQAAAVVLRTRIDRPELRPDEVRALMVSAGEPLPGVRMSAQGGGRLASPGRPAAVLRPPILTAATRPGVPVVRGLVEDLSGSGGRYRVVVLSSAGRAVVVGPVVVVPPGGRAPVSVALPQRRLGWSGRVAVVEAASGRLVSSSPAATFPPRRGDAGDLGTPVVTVTGGVAQAVVRVGRLVRTGDRLRSAPMRAVRVLLEPADGSRPLVLAGLGGEYDWPAGTYRFVLSRRLPTGGEVPAGSYRLRVSAVGAEGRDITTRSAAFELR